MQTALAQHDAIIRNAVESHGGYVVKTTGDGAHAAFAIATDALAASVAAQRALATRSWGQVRIESRMALHTGAAEERDGDYFGPVLNRAARLMAAAHGGQILLSLATEELVRDHLAAGVQLQYMGERRLKDLNRPERIFQVVAPELRGEFPPLNTLDARPNNLPAQTTPFIGREDACHAIRSTLADAKVRLMTLSGAGGTGKTRLALQVAADVMDDFEHGVFFVQLAAVRDPTLVVSAIAQTLEIRVADGMPLQKALENYLRDLRMLLVLDNFEQVVEAAPLICDLLAAAPKLKVLVTSRELLRVSGEHVFLVPTLSAPNPKQMPSLAGLTQYDAVALFIDRAKAIKPDFLVTNDNAPAVAEICFRLDGLPLAIELAAARVRILTPKRMLAQLADRLDFVKGGARDRPQRQQTLRATIDWSHDLLTTDEKHIFRQLAVFGGGSTHEAVDAICRVESDPHVFDIIESLAAKNLIQIEERKSGLRFVMLETIRAYASEVLRDSADDKGVRERHREFFLSLAEEGHRNLGGPDQAEWLQRLEEEHDNLRLAIERSLAEEGDGVALRFCAALQRFWHIRGHFSEGRRWCARALDKEEDDVPTRALAMATHAAGVLAYFQGDFQEARRLFEGGLAISRQLGDRAIVGTLANALAITVHAQGDYSQEIALHEEALDIAREMGDQDGISRSLSNLGNAAFARGDLLEAKALKEESLDIERKAGNWWSIANILHSLGFVAHHQGDNVTARKNLEDCLAIRCDLGDRSGMARALGSLGMFANDEGDYLAARRLHNEALLIWKDLGDGRGTTDVLAGMAETLAATGKVVQAANVWGMVERMQEERGWPLPPIWLPRRERLLAAARASLGSDAAFDYAWEQGRGLSLEQAIEIALEETSEARAPAHAAA